MDSMYNITKLLEDYLVFIPEIQRDYAQGRENAAVIRENLLNDIFDVLTGKSSILVLNYIYGVPTNDGKIILIDGQQRTTTLFLIKWYIAVKKDQDVAFLSRMKYATRDSSTEFCAFLKNFGKCLRSNALPSNILKNHNKFKKRWLNDPTVVNMINMLDAVDQHYKSNENVSYSNLDQVKFSFIALDGFKRTNELYAAMNSRGKQLTPFERLKGILLKLDSTLAGDINGRWTPAFWNIAKSYASDSVDREEYAANNHDAFLYNYFSFISQMIWWSKSQKACLIKKGDAIPDIADIVSEVYCKNENIEFLKFAMELAETRLRNYFFEELTRDESLYQGDQVVIYDGRSTDELVFFKLCCFGGKEFTQAARCYLWTYIKYCWDNKKYQSNKTLIDYFVLMRGLYMRRASNDTPTSVDKLSLNEELLGDVIRPFNSITYGRNEFKDYSQYKVYHSTFAEKYQILNNPLVRGCTDNISDWLSGQLLKNLNWIQKEIKTDSVSVFKKLAACGYNNLKCEYNGYYDRVFLPISEKMLKSVFTLRSWINSKDFQSFIEYLSTEDISIVGNKTYTPSDWEFYVEKYPSFRSGAYGQYRVKNESDHMGLDAEFIENERATKNKIRNPFMYEIYLKKKQADEVFSEFLSAHNVSFKQNLGHFILEYDGNSYTSDWNTDIVEAIIMQFP